jgi:hypothetical protein
MAEAVRKLFGTMMNARWSESRVHRAEKLDEVGEGMKMQFV